MSSPPKDFTTWANSAVVLATSVTSVTQWVLQPPLLVTVAAVSLISDSDRAEQTTLAPACAYAIAIARPMPRPAPVITATFPSSRRSNSSILTCPAGAYRLRRNGTFAAGRASDRTMRSRSLLPQNRLIGGFRRVVGAAVQLDRDPQRPAGESERAFVRVADGRTRILSAIEAGGRPVGRPGARDVLRSGSLAVHPQRSARPPAGRMIETEL